MTQRATSRGSGGTRVRAGADGVKEAALEAIRHHGYHGTTMRDIAAGAGVTVAALYYHYPSKHDLLESIIAGLMADVIADLQEALTEAPPKPPAQLAALVRAHCGFHTTRQRETLIANTELRSLERAARARVVAQRDAVERLFRGVVTAGQEQGEFRSTMDPRELTRGIIAMSIHVAEWYHSGALGPEAIGDRYAQMALDLVRARSDASRRLGTGR